MSYLYQHSGKNISLAAGSCLTAPIICGSTCVQSAHVQSATICGTTSVRSACLHSTGNICGSQFCASEWFRSATGKGMYNEGTGVHWYSSNACNMILYSGQANNVGIIGQACGANRGCIHWNCFNQFHIYDHGNNPRFLVNGTSDIRLCNTVCQYGNFVSTGRGYFCSVNESLNFKGARGCFSNEYMHLYRKVGIGHPSGWGCGEGNTPDKGLSTYGKSCIGYGITAADNNLIVNGGVETTGAHGLTSGSYGSLKFYPDYCAFWNVKAGGSSGYSGIKFRDSGGTVDGYVYADNGHIGFLDMDAHWAYGHANSTCHWWNINNVTRMRLDTDTLCLFGAGTCARFIMYDCRGIINGYLYANCNRDIGILDGDGNWAIRHRLDTGTYWSINNTDEMCLTTTCLCHSGVICAASCMRTPSFCGTTCVRTPVVCATTQVTAPNVYSNGASVTSMAQGTCFWRQFMVCGDADTFYPVCYFRGNTFGYKRYSINRSYNSTAPNTWHTSTHKGGLNYTWEQTSDTQWGGNDRSFRVNQVRETYTTVIGGHVHTVSGGVVLLRGGGALYCYASDAMCTSCVCVYDGAGGTDSQGMTHSSCTYFCPGNCACVCALTCANASTCRNSTICNTSAYPLQMHGVGNASAVAGCFCVVRSAGHVCAVNNVCGACLMSTTCVAGPVIKATNCVYACCGIDFVHSNWSGEKTKIQAHSTHLYFQNYNSGCFFFRNCHGTNVIRIGCDGCLYAHDCIKANSNICSALGISGQSYVRSPGYLQTGNHIYAWSHTQNCTTFGIGNADGNGWIHPLKVCRCGTVVIDNGSNNSSLDAALFICQTSNSDWAQIICKNSGSGTDYGIDVRVGASAGHAYYARFNNTIKFIVRNDCLCHNVMICSPAIKASSYMNSGKFCAGSAYLCNGCLYVNGRVEGCCHIAGSSYFCNNCLKVLGAVCSTTGFYGDGSNLTGISAGAENYCVSQSSVMIGVGAICTSHTNCCQVYIGCNAGGYGSGSTAVGTAAGQNANSFNLSLGYGTHPNLTSGLYNIAMGTLAGQSICATKHHSISIANNGGGDGCCVMIANGYQGILKWGNQHAGTGQGCFCIDCFNFSGAVSKSSGTFKIMHPNPEKHCTKDLNHSFVESPNEGDNIYRWQVKTTNCSNVITLPNYYRFLNKNDVAWVAPHKHFGAAYGEVTADQCCLVICSNADGCYNVLLIGTRKDPAAERGWNGVETDADEHSPNMVERKTFGDWTQTQLDFATSNNIPVDQMEACGLVRPVTSSVWERNVDKANCRIITPDNIE